MKKTFLWFFVAGVLNGVLLWMREQLKEGDGDGDDHQRVSKPTDGNPGDAAP